MGLAETARLTTILDLKDGLSSGLHRASGAVSSFSQSMGRVGKGVGQVGQGLARVGAIAGGVAAAGLAASAKAAIDFEDAFAGVRKTMNEADLKKAGMSFESLALDFRKMATEIPISAVEFARIGEIAGQLGIRAKDIKEFTRVTALMGVTTNLTSDAAADAFGRIGTILNLRGKDFTELADSIVALGNAGASTESEITEILKRFAAEGKAAGIAKEQMAGLASVTASLGFGPERGGTALSRVFANMATNIATANAKGKALSKELGQPIRDLQRDIDNGRGLNIFMDILKQIRDMKPTEAARFLKSIGVTNVSDRTIFRAMSQQLPEVNRQIRVATDATGALSKEAEKRFDTVKSKIQLLRNNLVEAGITLGEGFAPALGRAAVKLSDYIKNNRAELLQMGRDIGKAFDSIDWNKVGDGVKTLIRLFKQGFDIIRSIPPEITATVAGLVGLNKLSGGLLGSGVGNILGGLGTAVTKGVLSKIPGVGSFVAQPVYVTNWPAGGLMGGAAGAGGGMGLLGKLALGGMIVGTVAAIYEAVDANILKPVAAKQTELAAQAEGIKGEGRVKATSDLINMTRLLRDAQGFDRITIDTTASKEIGQAMMNAVDEMAKDPTTDRGQMLQVLRAAKSQAEAHGWESVATHIGNRIQQLTNKTPTANEIGAAVEHHDKKKDRDVVRLTNAMKHLQQVDTHKGNRRLFGESADKIANMLKRSIDGGHVDHRALRAVLRATEREQKRALAAGHTKLARNLGHDIDIMKRALGMKVERVADNTNRTANKLPTEVNVTVPVTTSVTVRDTTTQTNVGRRYGMQAV